MDDADGAKTGGGAKYVSVDEAEALIKPGSRIYLGTACAAPRTMVAALEAAKPGLADVEFVSFVTTGAVPQVDGSSTRCCRT